ncbi:ribosomal rna-processing [Plasmopara halstedii]|uniref:Ribosomal RNA-processing protein 8 n=1 Tax=Plasmopara halstedii TaxID=4781 RepID=A0A0P1ACT3_PLAHL|nr:ribosomal rna-processing [Plasmopara halstedii]CEG38178.1 ribosomal rna-processing [Plasmopara halstedii]|eukprot:XP_024574547.1 ribosomal rna-processing [Plasmopara halstedii]
MGKKGRQGPAKGKPTSAGGNKKAKQKRNTQQIVHVSKSRQTFGKGKTNHKANSFDTPTERLAKMRRKIDGGKFRMLNEQLYTTTGTEAYSTYQQDPELFDVYHQGFREMANKWPANPLDTFIEYVRHHPEAVVADFGCGDARLAESVPNKVHSFDLVSRKPIVTACNIAAVPLEKNSVDIAIYCLALMGTSIREYLLEVHRVLRPKGVLKVAEVKSRFETESLGGINGFVQAMRKMGFDCRHNDDRNKMFVLFEFVKSSRTPQDIEPIELKACEYKRR